MKVLLKNDFGDVVQHDTEACKQCKEKRPHNSQYLFEHFDKPMQPTVQQRIEKRIAEKDANFYVLNGSNAASEIVAALIQIGEKDTTLNPLAAFEKLRDQIIDSNLIKSKSLQ